MSPEDQKKLDDLCINTIRLLAVDMVEKANSGHPGMPLGAATMAYTLWSRFMRFDPENPSWANRDRFILSAGHGSALLYALLHLAGYDLPMDEIKNFRQWESLTPGHPEYGLTAGVEATTGPLGQGFAMGVGMSAAEILLAGQFNRPEYNIVDHYTYAIVSDGDLMEGVAAEAASLAGTMGLGKLIYLYDDNKISIEGSTDLAFTEDVSRRFQAYGWQVIRVAEGNAVEDIEKAITNARAEKEKPSLIMIRTNIGYGSPKQDSSKAHGEPLGAEAIQSTKEFFGFPADKTFYVPDEARDVFAKVKIENQKVKTKWETRFNEYAKAFPAEANRFKSQVAGVLPADWQKALPVFPADGGKMATRAASGKVLNALAPVLPNLVGGSADLAPSNKTLLDGFADFGAGKPGARNIRFGVREHAMGAIVNGMALHGGILPYGGTFFVFSDFMRPSLRLAALMNIRSIFVFTHDSVGVGEDGPTHQPVEHLASLRAMPNFTVIRPADANETSAAWATALASEGPTALVLTRQGLPVMDAEGTDITGGVAKGAYVAADADGQPDIILLATGSEVSLALEAKDALSGEGIQARVVSMPSWELFAKQSDEYREQVLPSAVEARLAIEAGTTFGWERYTGSKGGAIGIDRFGASAPAGVIFKNFGFTVENLVSKSKEIIGR